MGGKPVSGHPSCCFFSDVSSEFKGLILVIYVDDLLVAGPEDKHEMFWARLSKDVSIEEPEELER